MSLSERRLRDAQKLLALLEGGGFKARLAGGSVRDRVIGREPADFDVATTARPEAVIAFAARHKIKAVPTGIEHGTVTLVLKSGPVEVTTLRRDVATDGRRAVVEFSDDFREDAARRDFTMNAMFEDKDGVVYDFFDGKGDLARRVIRFVGDAPRRIAEDYLRILRCFRFWARFGYKPTPDALAAIAASTSGLSSLSQERVTAELIKMLEGPNVQPAIRSMASFGISKMLLPELGVECPDLAPLQLTPERQRGLGALATWVIAAGLTRDQARSLGVRLRLSTHDIRGVESAVLAREALKTPMIEIADALLLIDSIESLLGAGGFEAFVAPILASTSLSLSESERRLFQHIEATEAAFGHRRKTRLPINGAELMARGAAKQGPELGALLELLRRAFLNGEWVSVDEGFTWLAKQKDCGTSP